MQSLASASSSLSSSFLVPPGWEEMVVPEVLADGDTKGHAEAPLFCGH